MLPRIQNMSVESDFLCTSASSVSKLPTHRVYGGKGAWEEHPLSSVTASPSRHSWPLATTPLTNHCLFTHFKEKGAISALVISPIYTWNQDWRETSSVQAHHTPWEVFHYTKVFLFLLHQFDETLSSTGALVKWTGPSQAIQNWHKTHQKSLLGCLSV